MMTEPTKGAAQEAASTAGPEAAANGTLKVAAIADLHVREDGSESYRELFGEISRAADVLVIAGDLTDLRMNRQTIEQRHVHREATARAPGAQDLDEGAEHGTGRRDVPTCRQRLEA